MLRTLSRLRRRLGAALLALPLVAAPASATWSIVAVDTTTGEVVVASATCLANFNLERYLPVILVGKGAAAAQSQVDVTATNRAFIRARMDNGFSPRWILSALPSIDPQHQSRQYGIVTLEHEPGTFTGNGAGFARNQITGGFPNGRGGFIKYAIQGNVLAGDIVVDVAKAGMLDQKGDLGQKVMRAMEVARRYGGDGRCSCSPSQPTSCGAPPPNFLKSSHVAFIVMARMGDVDGTCNQVDGCANGDYYLDLQRITSATGPDPVLELRNMYADWRADLVGRPDHILSQVSSDVPNLVADGTSTATITVALHDVEGDPLMNGGAALTVEWTGAGAPVAQPGPVTDLGNGSYTFALTAGTTPGPGSWKIVADDGIGAVRLWPDLALEVLP